jgi:hypothetical protein
MEIRRILCHPIALTFPFRHQKRKNPSGADSKRDYSTQIASGRVFGKSDSRLSSPLQGCQVSIRPMLAEKLFMADSKVSKRLLL